MVGWSVRVSSNNCDLIVIELPCVTHIDINQAYHGGWHGEAIKLRINRYCKVRKCAMITIGF